MKPLSGLLILAVLAAARPVFADPANPQCPPVGSGGVSTNWGSAYREHVTDVFTRVTAAARAYNKANDKDGSGDGLDPNLQLIFINDLPNHANTRMVDGSPLSALQKGTLGLEHDAVIYTFGVFEIACDEAQLGFFMAHELRHIKKDKDGKTHFDRVAACRQPILKDWLSRNDVSSYYPSQKTGNPALDDAAEKSGNAAAMAAFMKEKGKDVATQCVKPVENEADDYAFALTESPDFPYKVAADSAHSDPNRDARVQAFANAEKWLQALDISEDDPGHGTAADRANRMAGKAAAAARARQAAVEEKLQMSLPLGFTPP